MQLYRKLIPILCIRFQVSVIGAATMAPNQSSMFIFNGILMNNVWIDNTPYIGIIKKIGVHSGGSSGLNCCS